MSYMQAPFALVTAFTSTPFGGNPAAVVFLDPLSPQELLGGIAKNLNQTIITFVSTISLPSDDDKILVRSVKYLVPNGTEVPICGHGTLAASKVLFDSPEAQASGVHTIHFKTTGGATLKAIKLEDGLVQIDLPSTTPGDLPLDEKARLQTFVDKAFGRNVSIKDIKTGGEAYDLYVMIELDEAEDLAGSTVDAKQLTDNGYVVNIFTTATSKPDIAFVSRMFAPLVIGDAGEDHVCGSAHGVLSPYWYSKLGIASGKEVKAKQVSARGGDLRVVWDQSEGRVKLRGQCVILATGNLNL